MMHLATTCQPCGHRHSRPIESGDDAAIPAGWTEVHDYRNPTKTCVLCPECITRLHHFINGRADIGTVDEAIRVVLEAVAKAEP